MEIRGKYSGAHLDLKGNLIVEFSTVATGTKVEELETLKDKLLDIKAVAHREKRSLNANAYFHVLCDKIAKVNNSSMTETKNHLIQEYGSFEVNEDGGHPHIILDDTLDYLKIEWLHLYPTQAVKVMDNGRLYRVFLVKRGSHTYNTEEMARLIDGTVSEAKALGIETLTPNELARMKEVWKVE